MVADFGGLETTTRWFEVLPHLQAPTYSISSSCVPFQFFFCFPSHYYSIYGLDLILPTEFHFFLLFAFCFSGDIDYVYLAYGLLARGAGFRLGVG